MNMKGFIDVFCMELALFDGDSFELLLRLFFVHYFFLFFMFHMKGYGVAIGNKKHLCLP